MTRQCWVACVLAACGGGGSSPPDGHVDAIEIDAAIDAPGCSNAQPVGVSGPALPPVTTETQSLTVIAHDASGAICNQATGTADARVVVDVPPGGMVTMVVTPSKRNPWLFTWTDVKPGDELLFPSAYPRGITEQVVHAELNFSALEGAISYDVDFACEHGGGNYLGGVQPGTIAADVSCRSDSQTIVARVQATTATSKSFALGTITAIAASGTTTIPVAAFAPTVGVTATIHGATGFDHVSAAYTPGPTLEFSGTTYYAFEDVADPVTVGPVELPATGAVQSTWMLQMADSPGPTLLLSLGLASPMPIDLTIPPDFLPAVRGTLHAGFPRPLVSWAPERPVAVAVDGMFVRIGDWVILASGQSALIRFPELPAALVPTGTAELQTIEIVDSYDISGYDALRVDPLAVYIGHNQRLSGSQTVYAGLYY